MHSDPTFVTWELGVPMTNSKVCAACIVSLSVAFTVASNQAFGQWAAHGGRSVSTHPTFHPFTRAPHRVHRLARLHGRNVGSFFPGSFFLGPSNDLRNVEVAQPIGPVSGDFYYTNKYDVPWDWASRFPPNFFGSPPPEQLAPMVSYAPGCNTQSVTVPGADGKDQTVNMVRC